MHYPRVASSCGYGYGYGTAPVARHSAERNSYRPAATSVLRSANWSLTGVALRRIATTFALSLLLAGCSAGVGANDGSEAASAASSDAMPAAPTGEQVPLITAGVGGGPGGCGVLLYAIVDVAADPTVGTIYKGSGTPLRWRPGYTAWRAGGEVEVRNASEEVVLTTGGRYWICPAGQAYLEEGWIVGWVLPCPDGELGMSQMTRPEEVCGSPPAP